MYNGKQISYVFHTTLFEEEKKCLFIYKYSFMTYGGLVFSFACVWSLNATLVGFIEGEVIGI